LKTANESLIEHNKELLSKCWDMEQHLSEVTKEKHKVEGHLQLLSLQVLSETTLKSDHNKVKYRIRTNISEELNLVNWRIATQSPSLNLANIFSIVYQL